MLQITAVLVTSCSCCSHCTCKMNVWIMMMATSIGIIHNCSYPTLFCRLNHSLHNRFHSHYLLESVWQKKWWCSICCVKFVPVFGDDDGGTTMNFLLKDDFSCEHSCFACSCRIHLFHSYQTVGYMKPSTEQFFMIFIIFAIKYLTQLWSQLRFKFFMVYPLLYRS